MPKLSGWSARKKVALEVGKVSRTLSRAYLNARQNVATVTPKQTMTSSQLDYYILAQPQEQLEAGFCLC